MDPDEAQLVEASQNERKRMKRNRWLATVVASTVVIMTLMGFVAMGNQGWERTASNLVDKVTDSDLKNLPLDIGDLKDYPIRAERLLDKNLIKAVADPAKELNLLQALLVLYPSTPTRAGRFYELLIDEDPNQLQARLTSNRILLPEAQRLKLRQMLSNKKVELRAACILLAQNEPPQTIQPPQWNELVEILIATVVKDPSGYKPLLDLLRPAGAVLEKPLARIFHDGTRTDSERFYATSFLKEYVTDEKQRAKLLMDAAPEYYSSPPPEVYH